MAQTVEDILKIYIANLVCENAVLRSRNEELQKQVNALIAEDSPPPAPNVIPLFH